jgi:hypothetical protein
MRSFTISEQARNATVKGIIKIMENLLHDTGYFLVFAETHRTIMYLPGTITIL